AGNISYIAPTNTNSNLEQKDFPTYAAVKLYQFTGNPNAEQILTITGFFEQAAYISFALYYMTFDKIIYEQHVRGDQLSVMNDGKNPFIKGNPSVFSYERPSPTTFQFEQTGSNLKSNSLEMKSGCVKNDARNEADGFADFYRTTTESYYNYEFGLLESIASDGCSPDYLYTAKILESRKIYGALKIKVPTTFISNDNPELIYDEYQVQELTIDTYRAPNGGKTKYGINSRQLNDFKDSDGYAYVFLAPEPFVDRLAREQGLDYNLTKIPPIYEWNGHTGYVLEFGAMNIRHRNSDVEWEGCLLNTKCYITNDVLEPILPSDLGIYYPELTLLDNLNNPTG
ncbi:TPA: hypothetical protein O8U14_004552, partial [Enterobacter asburiae]|nr:hypothetical protein [Enterobacter asburiae]